jgi:Carboxypeptidase regulatory-like domain
VRAHRGALTRIGVVAVLALGSIAVTAAPALADAAITVTRVSPTTLTAGQTATLQYTVENDSNQDDLISINVDGGDLACSGACSSQEQFQGREQKNFTATLRAPNNLAAGSNRAVNVTITANGDGDDDAENVRITLRGPDAPQTVQSVSGRVVNVANSRGIADATVALNDATGRNYTTETDNDGDFKFTSTGDKPIAPGQILLAAGKDGFQNNTTSTNASAGQAKTGLRITLRSTAQPSPSVSAVSPTPEESLAETPSEEPSAEESIDAAAAGNSSSDSGGGGLFSWVVIILGGLMVALGVGAIVLLVIRRKEGGEDDTGDPLPDPHGPRPTPGAHGVYRGGPDPTMVTGGAAMGGGPTMAMGPGLASAPTMMHQPVDEYGDPYGTPMRAPQPNGAPQPGYGYGYQDPTQVGYGPGSPAAPTGYGTAGTAGTANGRASASASVSPPDPYAREPRDYAPPASPGGGYGHAYDEPTGRYDPNGGYGADRGGYGGAGYGSGNGYGQQDDGYAPNGDGYGANGSPYGGANGSGGYEPEPRGGYDGGRYPASPASGYGAQGGGYGSYEQGGGGGYGQSGYEEPRRGYDQGHYDEPTTRGERGDRGDRGGDRGERGGGRGSRRSLDWLDD